MSSTTRMIAVVVALLGAAACDSPADSPPAAPSAPASVGAWVAPPLRLPSVAPGADCPAEQARPWSGPGQAARVLGAGPVHPVGDYFHDGTALTLRPMDRQPDGTYVKKVRWIAAGYTGPVLVRAARIDAPGAASARFSYTGQSRDGGHHAELTRPDSDLPATTTVDGPGCYAYQVDGTTFSYTIVFRAVPEPG
jgi:hypothetical protein